MIRSLISNEYSFSVVDLNFSFIERALYEMIERESNGILVIGIKEVRFEYDYIEYHSKPIERMKITIDSHVI